MPIECAVGVAIGSGRNHDQGTSGLDFGHEMVGAVALVGDHDLTRQLLDQCRGTVDIGNLPGREDDAQRIAQCIDSKVQFNLVANPPRERPIFRLPAFLGAGKMLVSTNDAGVDEQLFHVGIATQHVGHTLPDAAVAPTGKAHVGVPPAKPIQQVSPRTAGAQNPEDRLDEKSGYDHIQTAVNSP